MTNENKSDNLKWYETDEHNQRQIESIKRVFKKIETNTANSNKPTSEVDECIFSYANKGSKHKDYSELFNILDGDR